MQGLGLGARVSRADLPDDTERPGSVERLESVDAAFRWNSPAVTEQGFVVSGSGFGVWGFGFSFAVIKADQLAWDAHVAVIKADQLAWDAHVAHVGPVPP